LSRKSTKKEDLPAEKYPLTELDEGLVGWDSQDDPSNPRNFSNRRKLFILFLVSAITFLSPLASSIFAPGIPFVNADFHNTSQLLGSFAVSVYVLGFAVSHFHTPLLQGARYTTSLRLLELQHLATTDWTPSTLWRLRVLEVLLAGARQLPRFLR
jgi:hypothetical protein